MFLLSGTCWKIGNVAVWSSCYAYIFAFLSYLTTVNKCLTIFFSTNYGSLQRSPLDEAKKKHQTMENLEM